MKPARLFKTTIIIWSDEDPANTPTHRLVTDADMGGRLLGGTIHEAVEDPLRFPNTVLFDLPDPEPEFPRPWKVAYGADETFIVDAKGVKVPWELVATGLKEIQDTEENDYAGDFETAEDAYNNPGRTGVRKIDVRENYDDWQRYGGNKYWRR